MSLLRGCRMSKFKVGDRVRISERADNGLEYGIITYANYCLEWFNVRLDSGVTWFYKDVYLTLVSDGDMKLKKDENMSEEFKVGDRVDWMGIEGVVTKVSYEYSSFYPVYCKFLNANTQSFTSDGKLDKDHIRVSLVKIKEPEIITLYECLDQFGDFKLVNKDNHQISFNSKRFMGIPYIHFICRTGRTCKLNMETFEIVEGSFTNE